MCYVLYVVVLFSCNYGCGFAFRFAFGGLVAVCLVAVAGFAVFRLGFALHCVTLVVSGLFMIYGYVSGGV